MAFLGNNVRSVWLYGSETWSITTRKSTTTIQYHVTIIVSKSPQLKKFSAWVVYNIFGHLT